MRRFSLGIIIIVLLAGAVYGLASGTSEQSGKDGSASNDAANTPAPTDHGAADARSGAVTPANRRMRVTAEFKALEAVEKPAAPTIAESNSVRQMQAKAPTVEADSVDYADSHVPSSTNATEIGPALAKLSLIDLKMAAQQEFARLGCYKAKIDGLWGPRSRAAVQAFNQRVEGGWDDSATAPLVKALRSAPDGLCERDCSANAPGESCVIALSEDKDGSSTNENNAGLSYLPPWMRGQKLASTEADALMSQPEWETAQPSEAAPQRARRASHKAFSRKRFVDTRRKRSAERSAKWLPSGWPGANR